MSKQKVMGQARMAIGATTKHLRFYGMGAGVDSANVGLVLIMEWAFDQGAGKEYPCPVNEKYVEEKIKW